MTHANAGSILKDMHQMHVRTIRQSTTQAVTNDNDLGAMTGPHIVSNLLQFSSLRPAQTFGSLKEEIKI